MGIDVRYVDLMPHVPMGDHSNVLEVYADCIGTLEILGQNFRATYITWGCMPGSGALHRVPVIKITRPFGSLFSDGGGIRTRLARQGVIASGNLGAH